MGPANGTFPPREPHSQVLARFSTDARGGPAQVVPLHRLLVLKRSTSITFRPLPFPDVFTGSQTRPSRTKGTSSMHSLGALTPSPYSPSLPHPTRSRRSDTFALPDSAGGWPKSGSLLWTLSRAAPELGLGKIVRVVGLIGFTLTCERPSGNCSHGRVRVSGWSRNYSQSTTHNPTPIVDLRGVRGPIRIGRGVYFQLPTHPSCSGWRSPTEQGERATAE